MIFRCRFIGFVFLFAMVLLGCNTINKGAVSNQGDQMLLRNLDAVILTVTDLPTMEEDNSSTDAIGGMAKQPPVVDGFKQSWNGTQPEEHLYVSYWLFRSVADTQKAANEWYTMLGAQAFYEPEPNAEEVIGDATWRIPNEPHFWFVKSNVLVYVMGRRPFIDQLPLTRSVARKIEAKIEAALPQE